MLRQEELRKVAERMCEVDEGLVVLSKQIGGVDARIDGLVSEVEKLKGKVGEVHAGMYTVYLLYKANVISRDVLRRMLAEVKKPVPGDLVAFLVEEGQK